MNSQKQRRWPITSTTLIEGRHFAKAFKQTGEPPLRLLSHLTSLDFTAASFDPEGLQLLDCGTPGRVSSICFYTYFPSLQILDISSCCFEPDCFRFLVPSLGELIHFQSLKMDDNSIEDFGFTLLAPVFLRISALTSPDVSENFPNGDIDGELAPFTAGRGDFFAALGSLTALKEFKCSNTFVDDDMCQALGTSFSHLLHIEILDLGCNLIGDAGCVAIVDGLSLTHPASLRKIPLGSNKIFQ